MSTANWTNSKVAAIRRNLRQSYEDLGFLLDGPVEILSIEKLYREPAENEWTVMENLAHIIEFMPYWADEVAKLVAQPGQSFGRVATDEKRLAAIRDHSHDTLAQIRAALPSSYTHLDEVLDRLKDSDLDLTAHHVRYGEHTLEWFIGEFITEHLNNHIVQIKECLQAIQ